MADGDYSYAIVIKLISLEGNERKRGEEEI